MGMYTGGVLKVDPISKESQTRKPDRTKPGPSDQQVGREASDAGCHRQDQKVDTPLPLLPKWHLHKLLLNELNKEAIRLMWL